VLTGGILAEIFPMRRGKKSGNREKVEGRIKN
jgi:hypothetical protein